MEKRTSLGVILCAVIIGVLATILALSLTGVFSTKEPSDNNIVDNKDEDIDNSSMGNNNSSNSEQTYTVYNKGDLITLSDGSKWLVLADSDKNNDVVKLMNVGDFGLYGSSCETQSQFIYCKDNHDYNALVNEYFNKNIPYKGSYIESLINSFATSIPASLKEVDGYHIRLLSLNDIFEYDNNWKESDGIYYYTGSNLNKALLQTWTMDTVEYEDGYSGRGGNFYVLCPGDASSLQEEFKAPYLTGGAIGLSNIKPVIYAYKTSL